MNRLSNKIIKAGAIGLAAMMMFTTVAFADEAPNTVGIASYDTGNTGETNSEEMPGAAGIAAWFNGDDIEVEVTTAVETTTAVPEVQTAAPETKAPVTAALQTEEPEEEHAAVIALEKRRERYEKLYQNLIFPDLDPDSESYINVREKATADSELVGKLYAKSAARVVETVEGEEGTWFKINSGSVTGYVKAYYFITGKTAEEMAKSYGYLVAEINTESLRLREKASLESEQIAILSEDELYPVTGEEGAFVKVQVDDQMEGFVLDEYVTLKVLYKKAISVEEEREAIRLEIEREQELERARKEAQEEAERARREAEEEAERERREAEREREAQKNNNNNNSNSNSSSNSNSNKSSSSNSNSNKSSSSSSNKSSSSSSNKSSSSSSNKSSSSSSSSSSSKNTSAIRAAIVKYAKSFVGRLQYVHGGNSLKTGTDCSGFTKLIFAKWGITLPRRSYDQRYAGKAVSSSNMRPGDICYYGGHVAIYIGDGLIVHAANPRLDVKISKWNYRTPITIRNVIGD